MKRKQLLLTSRTPTSEVLREGTLLDFPERSQLRTWKIQAHRSLSLQTEQANPEEQGLLGLFSSGSGGVPSVGSCQEGISARLGQAIDRCLLNAKAWGCEKLHYNQASYSV